MAHWVTADQNAAATTTLTLEGLLIIWLVDSGVLGAESTKVYRTVKATGVGAEEGWEAVAQCMKYLGCWLKDRLELFILFLLLLFEGDGERLFHLYISMGYYFSYLLFYLTMLFFFF